MAGDMRPSGYSSSTEDLFEHLSSPRRRTSYVLPARQTRQFNDGAPRPPSQASRKLKDLLHKVKEELYTHPLLGPGEDIRVLIVEKGQGADTVRCTLVPAELPSSQDDNSQSSKIPQIPYEALSYYWGNDDPSIPITISKFNRKYPFIVGQRKFWIRPNLHAALSRLRCKDRNVALWVDAVCINQDDKVEKTAQVSRMHEIYSKANNICIWLGVGDEEPGSNRQTFAFIREMLSLQRFDQLVLSEKHARQWFKFVELMRNRWFSRRWVVQELALAKEATVHYGDEVIQWADFKDAVALFVTKHDQIKSLLSKSRLFTDPDPVGDMRALGANTLVEATSNLFRRSDDGEILDHLMSLETLVSTLLAFEATDPRDTVYCVLSIANDTPYSDPNATALMSSSGTLEQNLITPNYDESLTDLFVDFIEFCVQKSNSLDILCRHWAPAPKAPDTTKLPSWISLIKGSPFGEPEAALQGRSNGESLVGIPSRQHQKQYNASAGLHPLASFGKLATSSSKDTAQAVDIKRDPHTPHFSASTTIHGPSSGPDVAPYLPRRRNGLLHVKGLILDVIDQLSHRAVEGMIFQESLEMGGWTSEVRLEKVPDKLWRTLVADRGQGGITNAPSWYHRTCLECLTRVTQNGDLSTSSLIENPNTPSTMVLFLQRVQQVVWNRKFLSTSGQSLLHKEGVPKLFGLAPTNAKAGDLICILYGCSVPVILRKEGTPDDRHYTFIGESYIHGMMDGEAVRKVVPIFPYDDDLMFEIR